jgi:hypothetical protein
MTTEESAVPAPLDQELLLAEIYQEVERRRASGDLPPEFEADLDRAFAELAPAGAVGDDSALALERVQRTAFIQPRIPLEHLPPPKSQVKRVLFKLMAWYVHFVTEQVTAFGGSVAAALRHHDQRLTALEEGGAQLPARLRVELDRMEDPPLPGELVRATVEALSGVEGRVLVAESGDGGLLRALRHAGLDAYGAEPRRSRLPAALRDGLEVRATPALEHLRLLGEDRLGAVVLAGGPVERGAPVAQAELAARAARVVRGGGVVLVVSQSPEAWATTDVGPAADLSPGRPLRPATWVHLLSTAGLEGAELTTAPPERPLPALDPDTPGADRLSEVLERLAPLVAPSPGYLVRARRRS